MPQNPWLETAPDILSTNVDSTAREFYRPNAPATSVGMESLPSCGSTLARAHREPLPPASTCGERKIGGEPPPHTWLGARCSHALPRVHTEEKRGV
jgi:hypothetical protein